MEHVNYIVQLNLAFERFHNDTRIKQGHMTLYLAFFQKWNREFFKTTITINRELIMERAKIKSKTTYHNFVKDLNDWDYLQYYPSYHPMRGSKIKMAIFCAQPVQNLNITVPEPRQNLVTSYKHKTNKNYNKLARPENELVVLNFFKENNWPEIEGRKFYVYYQTKNWKLSRGLNIKNWKTAANNFVKNGFMTEKEKPTSPFNGFVDRLHSRKDKDYGQPL